MSRGISACSDGLKTPSPTPDSTATTIIAVSVAFPVSTSSPKATCAPQRSRSDVIITFRPPSRSANTPPSSRSRTTGTIRAAITQPRPPGPAPVCRTAKAVATGAIEVPSREVR